ncbi:MAG: glutaredoxin family protein [Spirochaetaceae bacterium]|nr:MAG: glutaredoxin family protein [Spirochaetaceae bacterium]
MADILDSVEFQHEDGTDTGKEILVLALSTCAFCKRAMSFLRNQGLAYKYVFLDQIDPDLKRKVKDELRSRYESLPIFPVLVYNREKALSGFTEKEWRTVLGM